MTRSEKDNESHRIACLEHELKTVRGELQTSIRNFEISLDEQKIFDEEALSVNEEFQLANEELLTAKAELLALNEELTTFNSRLQETLEGHRTTANNLQNILYSTDVATLLLDTHLNIRFFTPAVKALFNIILGDIGRPLTDLYSLAADQTLTADVLTVLRTTEPSECEIVTQDGIWFTRRILPYRPLGLDLKGVVLTYTGIAEGRAAKTRLAEVAQHAKSRFLATASHDLRQPLQTLILLQGLLAKLMPDESAQHLLLLLDQTSDSILAMLDTLLDINQADACAVPQRGGLYLDKPVKMPGLNGMSKTLPALPIADAAEAMAIGAKAGETPAETAAPRGIFLVDDDAGIRTVMRAIFLEQGWMVQEFSSGEAFLAAQRNGGHAAPGTGGTCLLVDAYLPGISGLELLQSLRQTGNHLPSIMITGRGDVQMAVQAMRAGALDFIEKPVSYQNLLSRVSRALAQWPDLAQRSAWQEHAANHVARLTTRQKQIMELVIAGYPSKNIAIDLGISQRTVENHRAAIMKKTESRSLPALAKVAFGAGMKDVQPAAMPQL